MRFRPAALVPLVLGLGAWAQPYPLEADDRRLAGLANLGRYAEAHALAESAPERFAHWHALLLFHAVPPRGTYPLGEATVRAAERTCRYREANLEAAAYCHDTLALILRWRCKQLGNSAHHFTPTLAHLRFPSLHPSEFPKNESRKPLYFLTGGSE